MGISPLSQQLTYMEVNFIYDKGAREEDSYLIGDNIFGVFDGVNSWHRFKDREGTTGGSHLYFFLIYENYFVER